VKGGAQPLGEGDQEEEEEELGEGGAIIMQTVDAIRVPGLNAELNQQITKFDSSEFDVSTTFRRVYIHAINLNFNSF
jgi:hypothetical protein